MATILIVEDDSQLQLIYQKKLSSVGYTVILATTGEEAIKFAKEQKPVLILLDVMLPGGKNGFDVLEEMKRTQELASIPVIVLTNLDSEQQSAYAIGASDYIIKANTSLEEMVEKVHKYSNT